MTLRRRTTTVLHCTRLNIHLTLLCLSELDHTCTTHNTARLGYTITLLSQNPALQSQTGTLPDSTLRRQTSQLQYNITHENSLPCIYIASLYNALPLRYCTSLHNAVAKPDITLLSYILTAHYVTSLNVTFTVPHGTKYCCTNT